MKKSNINLIINREDYQRYDDYFAYLKIGLIVLAAIFFVVSIVLLLIIKSKTDAEEKLNLQKTTLLQILKDKKADEVKISYIEKKYQDLNTYLKDDAFSSPYYALLNSALQESSESATLKSFTISKNRDVTFTIAFTDFPRLMSFFTRPSPKKTWKTRQI